MSDKLVWIDLEMTGLENTDLIMEIACLITDKDLNIIEKGPEIVIRHSRERLDQMGEWCTKHHGDSGLTDACINSKFTVQDAESKVVDFIKKHLDQEQGMLAGNSVHADKQFLIREMPRIVELLHYRIVDVSTIKELCASRLALCDFGTCCPIRQLLGWNAVTLEEEDSQHPSRHRKPRRDEDMGRDK